LGVETICQLDILFKGEQNYITKIDMTPVVQLYIIRVLLGLVAAALSAVVAVLLGNMTDLSTLFNSFTVALVVYLLTYYILKAMFKTKIEKQSKILSTGIGMYFFAWIAFFVLFYTIIYQLTLAP
jgi:zinc transporter ZupT